MAAPQEPGAPRREEPRVLSSEPRREKTPLLPAGSLSTQFLLSSQAPGTFRVLGYPPRGMDILAGEAGR